MFYCIICSCACQKSKTFIDHYSSFHGYTEESHYACCENDCNRLFSSKSEFLRHLRDSHTDLENADIRYKGSNEPKKMKIS